MMTGFDLHWHRYEYEEDPAVCIALEHTAESFIFNSWENEVGGKPPEMIEEVAGTSNPGPIGGGWAH